MSLAVKTSAYDHSYVTFSGKTPTNSREIAEAFDHEVFKRYDSLTSQEMEHIFTHEYVDHKPYYEASCCLAALGVLAFAAGFVFPLFFIASVALLIASLAAFNEGRSEKKQTLQRINQYVTGLAHEDLVQRANQNIKYADQEKLRQAKRTYETLHQECFLPSQVVQEIVTPREIETVLRRQKEIFRFNENGPEEEGVTVDPKTFIKKYVERELKDHSEAFIENDPLQTILNNIATPEKRSTERGQKALRIGALVYIITQENKPVSSKFDAVLAREGVSAQSVESGTERVTPYEKTFALDVSNEKVSFKRSDNSQVTQVNTNRRFTVLAPDRNGNVHFRSVRTFPYLITHN